MDPILSNNGLDFSSPFLGGNGYQMPGNYGNASNDAIALMERNVAEAQERLNQVKQQRSQSPMLQHVQQATSTPIWDEISRIQDTLSNSQLAYLESVPDYSESFNNLAQLLNREYMRIMRPIVEATPDGKATLQKHLEILRRLVKQSKDAADQQAMLIQDYTRNFPHFTFKQYMELRERGELEQARNPQKSNSKKQ